MAKVWKDHPLFGQSVTYNGVAGCVVVDVKPGPMVADLSQKIGDFVLRGTIKLRLKYPGGAKVWTPPMEYKPTPEEK
jgi:hypothetical protein